MSVFDGPRWLAKNDMILSIEHKVHIKLSNGKSSMTDLNILTMSRAEMFQHFRQSNGLQNSGISQT